MRKVLMGICINQKAKKLIIFCQKVYQALKKPDELIKVEEIVEFWDRNPILRKPLEEIGIDWGHGRVWK